MNMNRSEIDDLRIEAYSAGDYRMAAICEMAMGRTVNAIGLSETYELNISLMSVEDAQKECERVKAENLASV